MMVFCVISNLFTVTRKKKTVALEKKFSLILSQKVRIVYV